MSIENALASLQAAVEALTAKIDGASVKASGSAATETKTEAKAEKAATTKAAKAAPAKKGPLNTREAMQALLSKVKEEKGAPAAKAIITETGGVAKMAEIPEDKIDAVFDAATAVLEADDDEGDDSGDGI